MNYLELAKGLALEAGEMMINANNVVVSEKSVADYVTNVDTAIEKLVCDKLSIATPDFGILGEEGAGDESTWAKLLDKEYCWVLDPLDGTANFAFKIPHFAFSLALQHKGEPVVGVVYDPCQKELFFAEKNKGAFLNGEKIKVGIKDNTKNSIVAIGLTSTSREYLEKHEFWYASLLDNFGKVRSFGASALDLSWLACGRIDAFFQAKIKPWDIAAAALICKEAGAEIVSINENQKIEFSINRGSVFCTNQKLFSTFFNNIYRASF